MDRYARSMWRAVEASRVLARTSPFIGPLPLPSVPSGFIGGVPAPVSQGGSQPGQTTVYQDNRTIKNEFNAEVGDDPVGFMRKAQREMERSSQFGTHSKGRSSQ